MKSKFLPINNQNIHYLIGGKGRTLLLIPSLWITSKSYKEMGDKLSKYFTVVIPDIYKGKSKFSKPATDLADYINGLDDFVNKLKIKNFYLLGISFAGVIATIYASSFPVKINKLLLISSSATLIDANYKTIRLITGYFKLALNNLFSIKGLRTNTLWFVDSAQYLLRHPRQYFIEALLAIRNYANPTKEIKVPSKLIFAKKDEFLPIKVLDANLKIKNLEIELIDKTHAWIFLEQEEAVKRIRDFFK